MYFILKVNIIEDTHQIANSAYVVKEILGMGGRKYKLYCSCFYVVQFDTVGSTIQMTVKEAR